MYYYGNNGYYGGYNYGNPCGTYVGTTGGYGYGYGAAIWIVLFILLVIIIGAGWTFNGNNNR
ncbi:MAG: sporulation protein YjcZ [bacterium]|nr:sporulation protein YjcZ [bacterium]